MCGIFGLISNSSDDYNYRLTKKSIINLAKLSQSRGKDSSGLCIYNSELKNFDVIKGPISAVDLMRRKKVNDLLYKNLKNNKNINLCFGHARLVTNGTQLSHSNNQPVIKDGLICTHNGIIVNVEELWAKNPKIKRNFEIDSEIIPALINKNLDIGFSLKSSVKKCYENLVGTASVAIAFKDINKFVLATNFGSLYYFINDNNLLFASEKHILKRTLNILYSKNNNEILKLNPNSMFILDLKNFKSELCYFSDTMDESCNEKNNKNNTGISKFYENSKNKQISTVLDINSIHLRPNSISEMKLLEYPIEKIKNLKRCSRCVLPETFPHIKFNQEGVCNYCENHKKTIVSKSLDDLLKLVEPYRSKDGSPDCLVPFSGGRDSMFVLHTIKKKLDLNPIAFTYDWGMVTDLARRNIARICGKLGIENIIVAADIHWKRANIKKNITAWLNNPELGMIPLFMAGDKYFFYYTEKIKKQTDIKLNIWGINNLENTDFKTGFAGLKPEFSKDKIYSLSLLNKAKLFSYVLKNVISSPGYINGSVFDSLGSFASRYITSKNDYYHLFDYLLWDEKKVEKTIISEYDWETAIDTKSTWRIGDGTASFYNYIYVLTSGFSENDTFRSNQIREGMISRDEALRLVYEENKPRYNSIKWYLDIIGLDFRTVIKKINSIKKIISFLDIDMSVNLITLIIFLS